MNVSSDFVNRDEELQQIASAVDTLQDDRRLLRTPIIEFHGVQGMGKSSLLREVQALCDRRELFNIKKEAEQFTAETLEEARPRLNKREPVVLILDELDSATPERLQTIETTLEEFIDNDRLFVVLASKKKIAFENNRSITRKLTLLPLLPLERHYCSQYLDHHAHTLSKHACDLIFEWTRGFPLAMTVMADALLYQHLSPEHDQDKIIHILIEEVIEKKLLANVASIEEKKRMLRLLSLFSIPRSFNLVLMQSLIQEFDPEDKLGSSLAYITLPPTIIEATSAFEWSQERAGYSIDTSLRQLFFLQCRIEQPERFLALHRFLAEKNKEFAGLVNGPDRIRYLREYFYHLAFSKETSDVKDKLDEELEWLVKVDDQNESGILRSLEDLLRFYEEFQQDNELKEALKDENMGYTLSIMRKRFLKIYRDLPENDRVLYLRRFFLHTAHEAKKENFVLIFEDGMRQIIKQENRGYSVLLSRELLEDRTIKELLGEDFDRVAQSITKLLEEG